MNYKQTTPGNFFRPRASFGMGARKLGEQTSLFNICVSTRLPESPIGKDLAFICIGDDGRVYFCKDDVPGRYIRATEWIATKLADHLGIAVADCVVLEDRDGQTFFGSRQPTSLADEFELNRLFNRSASDELGRPSQWLGAYLARVWAFDLFVDNPDRNLRNFILDREGQTHRLRAIDFASARLLGLKEGNFPIASDNTSIVGKVIRRQHGAHSDSALEMLDRIGAVPLGVIEGILSTMPEEWMPQDQMGAFFEVWSNGIYKARIARARTLIADEWTV